MIDIEIETLLRICDVPKWTEEVLKNRVSKSTAHRWRLRGCRGVKLETLMVGGVRHTSREALSRFFDRVTAASNGESQAPHCHVPSRSHLLAQRELEAEGF
jgi:hypothetical protein